MDEVTKTTNVNHFHKKVIKNIYKFIIDTNEYGGSFERPLCAYCTGTIGECEVGDDQRILFLVETKRDPLPTIGVADEHGVFRPCAIVPTPGFGNDGNGNHQRVNIHNKKKYPYPAYQSVAIFFETMPSAEDISLMKSRAKKYLEMYNISVLGFRIIQERTTIEERTVHYHDDDFSVYFKEV